ncbi:hypothetical protein SALCHL_006051 [Streptomyces albus subsp. chlorinus]|uniref:hypothetical protein n=1 Tax=Streptomyces albus TaxID=1888 RepID=UPI0031F6BE28
MREGSPPERASEVPVEFAAFCALYQGRYLQYAHSRLADPQTAAVAVRLAFTELAEQWEQALRSPHTNAYAWQLLNRHIRVHAGATAKDGAEDVARTGESQADPSLLPEHTNGTRILHQDLGMPFVEATELMGHTTPRPR